MRTALRSIALALAIAFLTTTTYAADRSDLAEKLGKSTVQAVLYTHDETGFKIAGYCTAFSINDAKDYFATAAHCVQGIDKIEAGGHTAFPIFIDLTADMAVLVIPDSGDVPALKLAHEVRQGMEVYNYGYGYGWPVPMMRAGMVAVVDCTPFDEAQPDLNVGADEHFMYLDMVTTPGQSGGPVVDAEGRVVTINQLGDGINSVDRTLTEVYKHLGKYWEKE